MIPNDGVVGAMFLILATIVLIAVGAVVTYSFDLTSLLPANVRSEEQAVAGRQFPSGVMVSAPGRPPGERIPYPVVNIGEAPTVFPQAAALPPV